MENKLSFIIVNYKSAEYLKNCIQFIKQKVKNINFEVVVVNNNDLEAQLPNGTIGINSGKNAGFGAACNIGAKIAEGNILCFLNPDTEIVSEDIKNLLDEFNKDDKLAIIGPKLLSDKNEVQWWCAGMEVTAWDTILNNFGLIRSKKIWESDKKIECAWVSGAALFIKKDIFDQFGGFNKKFFMYFEDIDLCKRTREAGYKVIYFPEVVIKHLGGRSFDNKKIQKKYFYTSQDYYFKKHFGKTCVNIIKVLRLFQK